MGQRETLRDAVLRVPKARRTPGGSGAIIPLLSVLLWGIGCLVGAGCANAKHFCGIPLGTQDSALIQIPPVAQTTETSCGYAALASVALYHHVELAALAAGTLPHESSARDLSAAQLVGIVQALGLQAYAYQGTVEDLHKNVRSGRPILILLKYPLKLYNYPAFVWAVETVSPLAARPHWVVVTGFVGDNDIVVQDPARGLLVASERAVDQVWAKTARVCVLVGKTETSP